MNHNDCDIARDLMPLSVDGVCSEGSQRFLDDHVAQCTPCRDTFARMKAGMPSLQPEPTQEAAALKQGLRYIGKRFKALWLTIGVLACAFVLLLAIYGIQHILWQHYETAPLSTYNVDIYSNDAMASLNLSTCFYEDVYNGFDRDEYYFFQVENGRKDQVILTYSVSWFPHRHKSIATVLDETPFQNLSPVMPGGLTDEEIEKIKKSEELTPHIQLPSYRYSTLLETNQLCVMDGKLYLIDQQSSVKTTTGRTLLVLKPGLPVYEVRLYDGEKYRYIYCAWKNDVIPDVSAGRVDEHGLPLSGIILQNDLDKYADLIVK